ncbi:MAG: heparan-alpha-glucosaminide N-acetyltransferase domain-containing protein [Terracidiphilus sp.]|jgi:predicted acyltransferase
MTEPSVGGPRPQRLISLDVVRGITIAFMIMVNNNGGAGSWGFMNHAWWNGLTATDLVFPTFVFVVGASIVFAVEARLKRGATRAELAWHTVRRAAILFLLGIVVNNFPFFKLDNMRFYGVLQRIAICYLVVGLFYLWDRRVGTKVAALVVLLVGYWVLLRWVPVPGAGMPGRDVPFMDQTQNLVSWLDRLLMPHHLYLDWSGPNAHNVRDPEGLLSDLPAIGTALLGLLTGLWLRSGRSLKHKAQGLAWMAVICFILGYGWSLEFPLNKNMWTSSYVLVAAGWSLTLLTVVFWVVEKWGWGKDKSKGRIDSLLVFPWLVLGSNAITAYMFSELVPGLLDFIPIPTGDGKHTSPMGWMAHHVFSHMPDAGWAAFAYSVFTLAYCFVPVWIMYRKRIFLKV